MSYKKSKENVERERDELFKEYEVFLKKTLQLSAKVSSLSQEVVTSEETKDFVALLSFDEKMKKLTRLTISLLYTEDPNNKEVLASLKNDIALAEMEAKKKNNKKR